MLATPETLAIAKLRHGAKAYREPQSLAYGRRLRVGDAVVSLHPAGHVLGSAQVAIEVGGTRAVVSGDYKRRADPSCAPFEPVACDLFVTEATFGLPVFRHPPTEREIGKLLASLALFPERAHGVGVYPLGKCQRLIAELRAAGWDAPIWLQRGLRRTCELYETFGVSLGALREVPEPKGAAPTPLPDLAGQVVLASSSALGDDWSRCLPDPVVCAASGWMTVRKHAARRNVELPLILSDHADWDELTETILETGAQTVWITHGDEAALSHWCRGHGIDGRPLASIGSKTAAGGAGHVEEDTPPSGSPG